MADMMPEIRITEIAMTSWSKRVCIALRRKTARHCFAVVTMSTLCVSTSVFAQQLPGLVLSSPTPVPIQPPPSEAPPPAAKPKPKSKPQAPAKQAAPDNDTAPVADARKSGGSERIVVLVNDDPITAREIEQRTRFMAISTNIGGQAQEIFKRLATSDATNKRFRAMVDTIIRENQGKIPDKQIMAMIEKKKAEFGQSLQKQALDQARSATAPKFRKSALDELIEEKLKLQEAKREKIVVTDKEIDRILEGIAAQNKQTVAQFAQTIGASGVDISTMKARFKANFAWRDVVRKTYGGQIQIIEPDIEKFITAQMAGKGAVDSQELEVQRIVFPLSGKSDQGALARSLADADALRQKFAGCKSMKDLVKDQPSAKFEAAAYVKPSAIQEPLRSMMLGVKDGELLPPQTTPDGVELVAICARRAVGIDDKQRAVATQELQSRQFEELAKGRLKELRRDARIEMRE